VIEIHSASQGFGAPLWIFEAFDLESGLPALVASASLA
jgi:hypothetical protein